MSWPISWQTARRFAPFLLLLAGAALVFAISLDRYLTLDALQSYRGELTRLAAEHRAASLAVYGLAYAVMVALSLPGGAAMTIAGGFLFGTWMGGAVTVVSATLGAIVVFLAARTAFGAVLRPRAESALARFERAFRHNAASYLLMLRLIPLFPFFVVNLAPAFLGVPLRVFAWTTFLGIIPGTFVYAAVGNGLGAVLDAGGDPDLGVIFRPEILLPLLALAALASLPILYKKRRARHGAD